MAVKPSVKVVLRAIFFQVNKSLVITLLVRGFPQCQRILRMRAGKCKKQKFQIWSYKKGEFENYVQNIFLKYIFGEVWNKFLRQIQGQLKSREFSLLYFGSSDC